MAMGIKVKKAKIWSSIADIVFCIDCSFSMIPVIDSIKENILALVKSFDEMEIEFDWRARVVGFRDAIVYDKPFVSTVEGVKHQLDTIKAQGIVENDPSPLVETIESVIKDHAWRRASHKIVMAFTDTGATVKTGFDVAGLIDEMWMQHIKLVLWCPNDLVYNVLRKTPRSYIYQFDDPIDFYYHKNIDFDIFFDCVDPRRDPDYPPDDIEDIL